ncbi:unnamed protein product [Caenorhabditis auriculariae]|uniref:Uncharacterized protein n=1 Tax=Caenorhabditis auriculariae TaxID=2777116 RepID=A0A8S1HE93_9PELO|nr:unnamed protein product [Caenorhabditis auriculariae]
MSCQGKCKAGATTARHTCRNYDGAYHTVTLTPGASYPPEKVISRARGHQICGGFLAILWRQLSKCDATEGFRFKKQQLESFVDDQPL